MIIYTKEEYNVAIKRIDILMKKGESNLTEEELSELKTLVIKAEQYEDVYHKICEFQKY